jgi:hypothetical protein
MLSQSLRDFADARDKDRGFPTMMTRIMRDGADEIDRLRAEVRRLTAERDRAIADREPYIEAVRRVGADAVRLAEALFCIDKDHPALRQHEEQR